MPVRFRGGDRAITIRGKEDVEGMRPAGTERPGISIEAVVIASETERQALSGNYDVGVGGVIVPGSRVYWLGR